MLQDIMALSLSPFEERWDGVDAKEAERFCGDVPKYRGSLQCSCSS